MSEATRLLDAAAAGHRKAAAELLPVVYDELRKLAAAKMARERADHTLDATALVHEAFLKLGGEQSFASRSHYFRAAAEAMRRILVDHARARKADKRGGGHRFELSAADHAIALDPDTLLAIDEAISALAADDPAAADIARLRLFAGQSIDEAANTLGVSRATAYRDWSYARAVLTRALGKSE